MTNTTLRFLNIIIAALLAGTSFGIWIGFNPLNLSASTYIEQQQNTIRSLNAIMTGLVISAAIVTMISAILQKNNKPAFFALLTAALFFIVCILISRLGNQPLNRIIMTWTPDSHPAGLSELRANWWSFHIMRTIAELIALALVTLAGIKKN